MTDKIFDQKYDLILFDLDGTLVDSERGVKRCILHSLNKFGLSADESTLHAMIGPPFRQSMEMFFGITGDESEGFIKYYRSQYAIDGWCDCDVYDGVLEMLGAVREMGKKVALATSKPIEFAAKVVDKFGISEHLDFLGAATDDKTRDKKVDVIKYVLDSMNVKDTSRVLMIGDRLYDIEGARQLDIKTLCVLWGYGSQEEFDQYGADYVVSSPADVVEFLRSH